MLSRKLCWLAAEAALLWLWVRFGSALALALGAGLVLIPLLSLPLNLYLRTRLRWRLTAGANLPKGSPERVVLMPEVPTALPVFLSATVRVRNLLTGAQCRQRLLYTGQPPEPEVRSLHCGRLRLTLERVKLYDCFGVIGIPVRCPEKWHITVQPDCFETAISLADTALGPAESEQYSLYRPGSDLTETFQLREYVPGDSPRQIHWKLSGKLDRLVVRDPGLPIVQDILLFWERTGEGETPASCDAQAEAVVSIGRALLEQDAQFRLGWNDTAQNRCVLHDIHDLDELIAVLPRLLSASGGLVCHAGAALLVQTRPDALCSHMVYVAHTPAPEVQDWQSFGKLTILTPDETNYPAQLAALEL